MPGVEHYRDATRAEPEVSSDKGIAGERKAVAEIMPGRRTLSVSDLGMSNSRLSVDQYLDNFLQDGSGLGLFVANLCIQEMGGAIGFYCARDLKPKVCKHSHIASAAPLPLIGGPVFWFDIPLMSVG